MNEEKYPESVMYEGYDIHPSPILTRDNKWLPHSAILEYIGRELQVHHSWGKQTLDTEEEAIKVSYILAKKKIDGWRGEGIS